MPPDGTFRITEMGTSAGSVPGVTDTFATALWAPDALLSMASVGIDGVNVHIRARYSNSALNATGPPRPLFYGLALAARTLGPGATLLPATVTQPDSASLKAWAVRVRGNRLHLLLINRGTARAHGLGATARQRRRKPAAAARPERNCDHRRDPRRPVAERRGHLAGDPTRAERPLPRRPLHGDSPGPIRRTAERDAARTLSHLLGTGERPARAAIAQLITSGHPARMATSESSVRAVRSLVSLSLSQFMPAGSARRGMISARYQPRRPGPEQGGSTRG